MTLKKDLLNTLKILIVAVILSFSISAVYAQWAAPTQAPPAGNVSTPVNVGGTSQVKTGGLGVAAFTADSAQFNGDVTATGNICDGDGCIGPETDPTVLTSVKDGVSWSELTGIPAGFADNIDNGTLTVVTASASGGGIITATCPGGYVVTGGGGYGTSGETTYLSISRPSGSTGWTVANTNTSGLNRNGVAYAMCAKSQ